jgi:ubiquinone/menaquinone biosynthesis C-methylase UbiE
LSYLSLAHRVPEVSALEPKAVTRFYTLIGRVPMVRTTHRHFVQGVLSLGVGQGFALDVGSGPGQATLEIVRQRPALNLVGMDLAAHMVATASHEAARSRLNGRGLWLQADGHDLPLPDDCFDLVMSSFALHHWHDPLLVLNEMARVLRRPRPTEGQAGGRYLIADVCREVNSIQRLFAYASIPAISLPLGSYWGYGGYYESVRASYTRGEAEALLDQSDLPPGEVRLESTWFVPILIMASEGAV